MSVLKTFFIHYEGQPGPAHAVPVSAGSVREAIEKYNSMPGTGQWTKIVPDGAFIDEELDRANYDRMIADDVNDKTARTMMMQDLENTAAYQERQDLAVRDMQERWAKRLEAKPVESILNF